MVKTFHLLTKHVFFSKSIIKYSWYSLVDYTVFIRKIINYYLWSLLLGCSLVIYFGFIFVRKPCSEKNHRAKQWARSNMFGYAGINRRNDSRLAGVQFVQCGKFRPCPWVLAHCKCELFLVIGWFKLLVHSQKSAGVSKYVCIPAKTHLKLHLSKTWMVEETLISNKSYGKHRT